MEMSDFEAACSYFDNGITFLRKKHWEEHYALSLEMFDLAAKCALANGDFVSLKLLSGQVIARGRSYEDKLNVLYFVTCSLASSFKLPESIEKGLDVLSQLGVELELGGSGTSEGVEVCVEGTKDLLSTYTYDELLNTRRMTDSTMIMAMKFLSTLMIGLAQTSSATQVAQQIIQLSLTHGMSPVSPLGFVHLGSYLAQLGDIRGGYNYVKLACSLLDKLESRECASEVICISTQVVSYVEPLQATLEYYDKGCAAAMASGDIFQASFNMFLGHTSHFFAGMKLQTTREKGEEVIKFMNARNVLIFNIPVQHMQNMVLHLIGLDEEPKDVSAGEENISENMKTSYYFQKLYISFIFRMFDDTKAYAEKFLAWNVSNTWVNLWVSYSFYTFYIGLVSFWVARNSRDEEQWYERGNKSKLALRKWAETSQWTFENKWFLLEAEEAFCNGSFDDAKLYYEKAVTSAKTHKFVHEEALACELAAYFYLEIGEANKAVDYCLLAHEKYQEWGAIGKCTSLFKFFEGVMNKRVDSSPAIVNEVQSELAHLLSEDSLGSAEVRKRRVDDHS
eukprot:scaffold2093_cov219-Skeletonema_menzelii.AAC.1